MYSFGLQHLLDICRKYRQWRSTGDLHGYCKQANEDYSFSSSIDQTNTPERERRERENTIYRLKEDMQKTIILFLKN